MNDALRQKIKDLPTKSGVYIMYSQSGQILYIGKAKVLKNRVSQYFNAGVKTDKVAAMVSKIDTFDYIITRNEVEALILENNLIKKHKPPYNILLKDDKSYPFIRIDIKSDFPRVEVVRKLKNDGAKYFGPYMQGITHKDISELIYSAFSLRSCNINMDKVPSSHRPCLNHHIGRCLAPCAAKVSKEDYRAVVDDVISFLSGNDKSVGAILEGKMQAASDAEDYELAMWYRDKCDVLKKIVRRQVTALPKDFNLDIFAVASSGLNTVIATLFVRAGKLVGGDKQSVTDVSLSDGATLASYITRYYDTIGYIADEVVTAIEVDEAEALQEYLSKLKGKKVNIVCPHQGVRRQLADMALTNAADYLEKSLSIKERKENMTVGAVMQLAELLSLKRLPLRMECYDISHISGTDKVASMVVFTDGEPDRGQYRKFRIKTVEGNDDFASLQETLTRRLKRLAECDGDTSLGAKPDLIIIDGGKGQLSSVMEIAEAAGSDIQFISLAKREEEVFLPHCTQPVILPRDSYALKLLQRIRDEAHRFAITFHRNTRSKRMSHSTLENIPNVGAVKAKKLLKAFRSMEAIKSATVPELLTVVDKRAAASIYETYHGDS
ncbi:MAG: excinuclease ABC subunit UvrC [Clostridia bacterium]|nr:excinuclease ABC subunit UvrC [Clostridia bacterium]